MEKKIYRNVYFITGLIMAVMVCFCFQESIYASQDSTAKSIVSKDDLLKLLNSGSGNTLISDNELAEILEMIDFDEIQKLLDTSGFSLDQQDDSEDFSGGRRYRRGRRGGGYGYWWWWFIIIAVVLVGLLLLLLLAKNSNSSPR